MNVYEVISRRRIKFMATYFAISSAFVFVTVKGTETLASAFAGALFAIAARELWRALYREKMRRRYGP